MQLKNVYEAIDALAPFRLSAEYCETYNFHDNSGILVDCGEEVRGILCSLDLSRRAVEEAKKTGANVIFTHHPAIFYPVFKCFGLRLACNKNVCCTYFCILGSIGVNGRFSVCDNRKRK